MSRARQLGARLHLPDYINACYENLDALIQGLIDFDRHLFDAVIAAVILERIDDYGRVLGSYFSRYFDATPHIEFYYKCVEKAIDVDLPQEADFLERNDVFKARVESFIEMPDGTINLLFSFIKHEDGHLPKHALSNKFKVLRSSTLSIALSAGTRNSAGALNNNTGNKIQVTIDECNIFIHYTSN